MQLLRGINHHLLTSHADLLNPGENLKVLWMIVEAKRKKEESEKKKSLRIWAASSLMRRLWSHYELTINSPCRFPECWIETNCLWAIQLHSSVPPDKKKRRKKQRLWRRITHKAVFQQHFLFVAQTQALWEDHHTLAHTHALTQASTAPGEVTISKRQKPASRSTLK